MERKNKKTLRKGGKNKNTLKKGGNTRNRKLNKKGGFGPASDPFIMPPEPWDATGYAFFFPLSKNGVTPGGVPPFFAGKFASPQTPSRCQQRGGNFRNFVPQSLLNTYRISETEFLNLLNRYRGIRTNPSPLPAFDQLNSRILRKVGF